MSHINIKGQRPTEFPVTIAEVIDRLVLTDVNEGYWLLNVGRFNAPDDVRISPELAEELLKLKNAQRNGDPTTTPSTPDYSYLDDPTEREWLTSVPPLDILKNAHRIYDFMANAGLPPESMIRELAFTKASEALDMDYEVFYQAWLNQMPVGPAAMRRATRS